MTAREKEKAKQDLHRLVDQLPDSELHAVRRFLEFLHQQSDPVLLALMSAPEDDEPETAEERAALAEAYADVAAGRLIPLEQVKRELGM
ncbi:MAG: hypothetical protein HYY01_01835 [Chloroflexi bacterium]|nr:hypothetical protein [Chloroflexota bacterium]